MPVVATLRKKWLQHLKDAELPDPPSELNALWRAATNDPLPLLASSTLTPALVQHIDRLVERRARREPLARITQTREFASLAFRLNKACLVPRPASETLLEAVLTLASSRYPTGTIQELGCGCGCILLALATTLKDNPRRPALEGFDASAQALVAARQNAQSLRGRLPVRFSRQSWSDKRIRKRHRLLFANPPYLRRSERITLSREVARFDPPLALDGGFDGMRHYRHILRYARQNLPCGGFLLLEHAPRQTRILKTLARRQQLQHLQTLQDLAGDERVTLLRRQRF